MAKVSFNKITPIKSGEIKELEINGEKIIVKQYLPTDELTALIVDVMNFTFDNDGFVSPLRYEIYSKMYIVKYFTNINITDTMIDNIEKTYDLLVLNNIINQVLDSIPDDEICRIENIMWDTMKKIQEYNTSFIGWIKTTANDKALAEMDLQKIVSELQNTENFETVKEVMENMT